MLLVDEQEKAPQEDKEEELQKQRLITKKLRKRYKEAKLEIDDLTKEFATFKQEHLAHIRALQKDSKFNNGLETGLDMLVRFHRRLFKLDYQQASDSAE